MSWRLCISAVIVMAGVGCRSALVVTPKDKNTQTVVTVQTRPSTNPSDPHLIVRDKS